MLRRPPGITPPDTRFPYTMLFRSRWTGARTISQPDACSTSPTPRACAAAAKASPSDAGSVADPRPGGGVFIRQTIDEGGRGLNGRDRADALAATPDFFPGLCLPFAPEVHLCRVGGRQGVGVHSGGVTRRFTIIAMHAGEKVGEHKRV